MVGNIILGNLYKLSLSKILIIGGFLGFAFLEGTAKTVSVIAIVIGFLLYFRRF